MAESKPVVVTDAAPPAATRNSVEFSGLVMPSFGGQGSLGRFLDDFKRFALVQGWSEDQKANVFPLSLAGVARDAYDSLSPHQAASFEGAAEGLRAAFSTLTVTDHHLALRELKFNPSECLDGWVCDPFQEVDVSRFPFRDGCWTAVQPFSCDPPR